MCSIGYMRTNKIIRAPPDKAGGGPIVITLSVHLSVVHDFMSAQ